MTDTRPHRTPPPGGEPVPELCPKCVEERDFLALLDPMSERGREVVEAYKKTLDPCPVCRPSPDPVEPASDFEKNGVGPCVVCGAPAFHLQSQTPAARVVCRHHKDAPWDTPDGIFVRTSMGTHVRWTTKEPEDGAPIYLAPPEGSDGPPSQNLERVLWDLAEAALAYDAAIRGCANDPDKMSSACSAQGDDLDTLYFKWQEQAVAAKEGIEEMGRE